MIAADHITFTDDGKAWWVPDNSSLGDVGGDILKALDRPCDTCRGQTRYEGDNFHCRDCDGTGRHTFTIEVQVGWPGHDDLKWTETHRVSVVPDMVLPIYDHDALVDGDGLPTDGMTHIDIDTGIPYVCVWTTDGWIETPITLPPAAAAHMWAALLEVHQ